MDEQNTTKYTVVIRSKLNDTFCFQSELRFQRCTTADKYFVFDQIVFNIIRWYWDCMSFTVLESDNHTQCKVETIMCKNAVKQYQIIMCKNADKQYQTNCDKCKQQYLGKGIELQLSPRKLVPFEQVKNNYISLNLQLWNSSLAPSIFTDGRRGLTHESPFMIGGQLIATLQSFICIVGCCMSIIH